VHQHVDAECFLPANGSFDLRFELLLVGDFGDFLGAISRSQFADICGLGKRADRRRRKHGQAQRGPLRFLTDVMSGVLLRLFFLAEWGDLTQLASATLAAT